MEDVGIKHRKQGSTIRKLKKYKTVRSNKSQNKASVNCNIKVLMEEKEKHHKSKITSDDKKEADLLEYAT